MISSRMKIEEQLYLIGYIDCFDEAGLEGGEHSFGDNESDALTVKEYNLTDKNCYPATGFTIREHPAWLRGQMDALKDILWAHLQGKDYEKMKL